MNTTEIKTNVTTTPIVSGQFSKKGNFTAYDSAGESYFVSKAKMDAIGITDMASFKMFFALTTEKTYNRLVREEDIEQDATLVLGAPFLNTDGTQATFTRTEATAVFKTIEEASSAKNAKRILQAKEEAQLAREINQARREEALADANHNVALQEIVAKGRIALGKLAKEGGIDAAMMQALTASSL